MSSTAYGTCADSGLDTFKGHPPLLWQTNQVAGMCKSSGFIPRTGIHHPGDSVWRLGRDEGTTMRAFMEPRQSVAP
ncbi:hypothetical protein FE553_12015 [Escherichia coli]|nr:hypothetical protein [Escherichia coli]